eukprot:1350021-Amorphochlora_amoeboformis.AAC.3
MLSRVVLATFLALSAAVWEPQNNNAMEAKVAVAPRIVYLHLRKTGPRPTSIAFLSIRASCRGCVEWVEKNGFSYVELHHFDIGLALKLKQKLGFKIVTLLREPSAQFESDANYEVCKIPKYP